MGKTNIEWVGPDGYTGNPWIGCSKVSPGCKNCYAAELDANRFSRTMGDGTKDKPISHWGKGAPRVRTKVFWKDALKWNREAEICKCGKAKASALHDCEFGRYDVNYLTKQKRPRIFPSLCDWLDDEVPIEWFADFLKLIHATPNLDWLLLTKRPENFKSRFAELNDWAENWPADAWVYNWLNGAPPSNVWLGVSVEDQKRADQRIPQLLQILARVRFLSVEPLLERVSIEDFLLPRVTDVQAIYRGEEPNYQKRWVIVGGESGKDRRDCGVEAIVDVANQCVAAGMPCFVKQDCAFKPGQQGRIPNEIWKLKQFPNVPYAEPALAQWIAKCFKPKTP